MKRKFIIASVVCRSPVDGHQDYLTLREIRRNKIAKMIHVNLMDKNIKNLED